MYTTGGKIPILYVVKKAISLKQRMAVLKEQSLGVALSYANKL